MDRLKGCLPTCPPGSTTTSYSDCRVPHETTRGPATDPSNNGNFNQSHLNDPRFDTADFNDNSTFGPGNLRVDYVLPSATLDATAAGVFWPTRADADFPLVGTFGNQGLYANFPTSDHKAVWVDVTVVPEPGTWALMAGGLGVLVLMRRRVVPG